MLKNKKKYKVTLDINEGWDARAWDKVNHYFVGKRAICNSLIRYKPPYFDAGFIPPKEEEYDYCNKCLGLIKTRYNHLSLMRFFK